MVQNKKKKAMYSSPIINLILVDVEESIASGSNNALTIGGPNDSAAPEIIDAPVENNTYDITF